MAAVQNLYSHEFCAKSSCRTLRYLSGFIYIVARISLLSWHTKQSRRVYWTSVSCSYRWSQIYQLYGSTNCKMPKLLVMSSRKRWLDFSALSSQVTWAVLLKASLKCSMAVVSVRSWRWNTFTNRWNKMWYLHVKGNGLALLCFSVYRRKKIVYVS